MPRAHEHATIASDQGKNMARRNNIVLAAPCIDCNRDRAGPITRANARSYPLPRFNRHRESRFMPRTIIPAHQVQPQGLHAIPGQRKADKAPRSEEHTSELQSLMRNSYAVFCLKKKKNNTTKRRISREKIESKNN